MKREILICVCALTLVVSTTDRMYACCEDPVSDFTMNSDDVVICQQITFDAGDAAYDPDYTTLTYEWDFGDGETASGEIVTHSYTCIGTKTVTLTVTDNDDPECCGGDPNCEDKTDEESKEVTVSLPPGCDDCTGAPVILLALNPEPSFDPSDCIYGGCGYIDKPTNLDIFIETPCYDSCTWRFGVTAIADVYYGPCLDDGNYTPIETGDDSDLTEENYCEIVDGFDYTPSDESTGTGCAEADGTQYSNTNCLMQHEEGHYDDQEDALEAEEDLLAFNPALDMQIDCSDPDSKTCTDAFNAREAAIIIAVEEAYEYCIVCNEEVARAAAEDCFSELANEICVYAASQGWTECDECD